MGAVRDLLTGVSIFALCSLILCPPAQGQVIERQGGQTLTPVEMDVGDELRYARADGEILNIELLDTDAEVLYTNIGRIEPNEPINERGNYLRGRTLYHFTCRVKVNGQEMRMQRYVGSQETFYEPYVINGVRIWFDAVQDIFEDEGGFLNEEHGQCKPGRDGRFALQDMDQPICPQRLENWCPIEDNFIDIGACFSGDDPWLGAFLGKEAHGGLDINHSKGTDLLAPIDFDDQWLFDSLAAGDNNNRWAGLRTWPDGSVWRLQVHHITDLLIDEHTPLKQGTHYAEAAGVRTWWHDHSHFVFRICQGDREYFLDPWIIFREIFENNKQHFDQLRASMAPLSAVKTGRAVRFVPIGTWPGHLAEKIEYYWTFGDGGWSDRANPQHIFTRPGIYPVTVTVDNGHRLDSFTQHITVSGGIIDKSALTLTSPDEVAFHKRRLCEMDTYGREPKFIPHTLRFTARLSHPSPAGKTVSLNIEGTTSELIEIETQYRGKPGWLTAHLLPQQGKQSIEVKADATDLAAGEYEAVVRVGCDGMLNSPQGFRVVMEVKEARPASHVVVDDKDEGFYCTRWFWVGHKFHGWGWPDRGKGKGYGNFYLLSGKRSGPDAFARFTPDVQAGSYRVSFSDATPFAHKPAQHQCGRVRLRVKSADGEKWLFCEPAKSRQIGRFQFNEGTEGFVEIHTAGSTGQVLADAIDFEKTE